MREIEQIDNQLLELSKARTRLDQKLIADTLPMCLLFDKGRPLEDAVIDALRIIGFKADRYQDDESEFDIVFESPEGRFLGEVEGKDSSPININKFQQLERNIQEDFTREDVSEYAKGVLFGNPHRLTAPDKRQTLFTKKALSAAKRSGYVLVHTPDLFEAVQYLKKKRDAVFARKAREAFAKTAGSVLALPAVPRPLKNKRRRSTEQDAPANLGQPGASHPSAPSG